MSARLEFPIARNALARVEVIADEIEFNGRTLKRGARFDAPAGMAHLMAEDRKVRFVTLVTMSAHPRKSWVTAW